MTIEAQELADTLRATARMMRKTVTRIDLFRTRAGYKIGMMPALEMRSAVFVAEELAKEIEKKHCKKPRKGKK